MACLTSWVFLFQSSAPQPGHLDISPHSKRYQTMQSATTTDTKVLSSKKSSLCVQSHHLLHLSHFVRTFISHQLLSVLGTIPRASVSCLPLPIKISSWQNSIKEWVGHTMNDTFDYFNAHCSYNKLVFIHKVGAGFIVPLSSRGLASSWECQDNPKPYVRAARGWSEVGIYCFSPPS